MSEDKRDYKGIRFIRKEGEPTQRESVTIKAKSSAAARKAMEKKYGPENDPNSGLLMWSVGMPADVHPEHPSTIP